MNAYTSTSEITHGASQLIYSNKKLHLIWYKAVTS